MKKVCSKCEEEKDSSEFHSDRSKRDGLYCSCKSCCTDKYDAKIKKNAERGASKKDLYSRGKAVDGRSTEEMPWLRQGEEFRPVLQQQG